MSDSLRAVGDAVNHMSVLLCVLQCVLQCVSQCVLQYMLQCVAECVAERDVRSPSCVRQCR